MEQAKSGAPVLRFRVLASLPHDREAFTQGLVVDGDVFHESVGRYGHSALREVDVRTGRVLREVRLSDDVFAEGLARVGDALVQLTWRRGEAYVHDVATFARTGRFEYSGQGWGLAFDGQRLVQSNGSDVLVFRDPATFAACGRVRVHDGGESVRLLNELEWMDGLVLANVWHDPRVAAIDPDSGAVRYWIDLSDLVREAQRAGGGVANGLAWDCVQRRLYVTGKNWPHVHVVEIMYDDQDGM
ncbi:glutamine cyclotransferase [Desulfobaculum xiamenense]|uniref:Glutamine cyclotransferase n=1 Tax=Desulfobaculum xiamenense TaxID=995050 RepID=A0A846QJ87_9BACT|nr:glutamine cyclotransferase [Desulfobaculum xiamenense]